MFLNKTAYAVAAAAGCAVGLKAAASAAKPAAPADQAAKAAFAAKARPFTGWVVTPPQGGLAGCKPAKKNVWLPPGAATPPHRAENGDFGHVGAR